LALTCENLFTDVNIITERLPATIHESYQWYTSVGKEQFNLLEEKFKKAYPALANKAYQRSSILNGLAGLPTENTVWSVLGSNQKFADFFIRQQDRMDQLEKAIQPYCKDFTTKELYKSKGYLNVWDSIYQYRKGAWIHYRNKVLKLVSEDIAYLKANHAIFKSANESERLQYIEAEVKVLQKLTYLKNRWYKIFVTDAQEKVSFCLEHPSACQKN
jgi:hypothetical protein